MCPRFNALKDASLSMCRLIYELVLKIAFILMQLCQFSRINMNNCFSLTNHCAQIVVNKNGQRQLLIETNDSRNYLRLVKAINPLKGPIMMLCVLKKMI